ncbi:MAG: YggS family pyridoxal phosphate-dependent enzyme, partial [Aureliella sp.]
MHGASNNTAQLLRNNWRRVSEEIAEACHAVGREADQVRIVGVSKYVVPELAWQLAQAGCHILAENRPQLLWDKTDYFAQQAVGIDSSHANRPNSSRAEASSQQWHLIGHLQRNKLRRTLPLISLLHSLDSPRLADAISAEGASSNTRHGALLEVNVTQDASKTGMAITQVRELLDRVQELPGLAIRGLMAMSSLQASPDSARREFEQVRQLRDQLQHEYQEQIDLSELSMGMSGDFREAIAAGATLV